MEKVYPTRENGKVNRRSFLIASSAAAALADAQTAPSAVPSRRVYSLNRNWLFGGKMTAGADAPGFDDTKFRSVTLPHTNVDLPWHSFNDKAYEFVSIYRRHFRAPAAWRGKRVFVDFGGAMTAAKVTINGHPFDEYRGGYTPFSFDLTPHLKFGADNLLAVELDSTERADIPPFGGSIDYLTFGGIYRDVELRVVPADPSGESVRQARARAGERPRRGGALLPRGAHRQTGDHHRRTAGRGPRREIGIPHGD